MSVFHKFHDNFQLPIDQRGFGFVPYILLLLTIWVCGAVLMGYACCAEKKSKQVAIASVPELGQQAAQDTETDEIKKVNTHVGVNSSAKSFTVNFANKQDDLPGLSPSEGFNFSKNSFQLVSPVDAILDANLLKLKGFFSKNSSRQLLLTGRYSLDEANLSGFPNLGLARANQVKNHLIDLGFNPAQLGLAAALDDTLEANSKNEFTDMVSFDVKTVSKADRARARVAADTFAAELRRQPMLLYFEQDEASLELDAEQRQQLLGVVSYLDAYSSALLVVIGHTDNTGDTINNVVLGQQRAQYVADFLQANGLSKSRFVVSSMGEMLPIASNSTAEGRRQNRRVVVTLN